METSFLQGNGFEALPQFLTSLAIGLLIGLERERNPSARAGLRTFGLVAVFGTLMALLSNKAGSPWLLIAGMLSVAGMITASYFNNHSGNIKERRSSPRTPTSPPLAGESDEVSLRDIHIYDNDPGTTTVIAPAALLRFRRDDLLRDGQTRRDDCDRRHRPPLLQTRIARLLTKTGAARSGRRTAIFSVHLHRSTYPARSELRPLSCL